MPVIIRRSNSQSTGRSLCSIRTCLVFVFGLIAATIVLQVQWVSWSEDAHRFSNLQELSETLLSLTEGAGLGSESKARAATRRTEQSSDYTDVETSCDAVDHHLNDKSWYDPNEGRYLIRKTMYINDNEPTFYVSVHKQEYDPLRYKTIYERCVVSLADKACLLVTGWKLTLACLTFLHACMSCNCDCDKRRGRYYEMKVIRRFNTILKPIEPSEKIMVVDVGANIGYFSLLTAAHGHRVVSFEINPANIVRFCESASLNRFTDRIHIVQRGVSAVAGKPLLVYVPKNPGEAQMVEPGQTHVKSPVTGGMVDIRKDTNKGNLADTVTVTLDQFAQDHGWFDTPGFSIPILKMDIEGHEPYVVQGARRLLSSGIVKNILTEFRLVLEPLQKEAVEVLLEAGYVSVDHTPAGKITKYTKESTWTYLKAQDDYFRKTRYNVDLWFQLESEAFPTML